MSGRGPARKGRGYEREVGKLVEKWLDGEAHRVPASGALPWMKGDLFCRGNVLEGWFVECKRQESAHIWKWMSKAEHQAERHPWIVFFRRSDDKSKVLLDAEDFLRVLSMLQEARAEVDDWQVEARAETLARQEGEPDAEA